MPTRRMEAQLIGPGIQAGTEDKDGWVGNMLRRNGGWEIRLGFGTVAQFDTTLSHPDTSASDSEWGYLKELGSYLMRTDQGHDQIITVLKGRCRTGARSVRDEILELYCVSIYDVTTNDRWEEVLHIRTAEADPDVMTMPRQHGPYSTTFDDQHASWLVVRTGEPVYFCEFADKLYFGNRDTGLLAYLPCTFSGQPSRSSLGLRFRSRQLETQNRHDWARWYEESHVVVRAVAAPGPGAAGLPEDAAPYVTESNFPRPVAATVLGSRMVYVDHDGRTVWFSDPNWPTSLDTDNFIVVDSQRKLHAVKELAGDIYLWSETETYVYRPASGHLASGGRLVLLSDHIGCVSAAAVTKDERRLVWVDSNGVHTTAGDLQIRTISDSIEQFFTGFLTNPLTIFYAQNATTENGLVNDQPTTVLAFDPAGVNIAYHAPMRALLVSVPACAAILCLTEGEWSMWSTESIAHDDDTDEQVKGSRNIANARLLSNDQDLFLVGGMDVQLLEDDSDSGGEQGDDTTSRSYYICRYGRGGGLDRNVDDEDYRIGKGRWTVPVTTHPGGTVHGHLYIGKPMRLPLGFKYPNANKVQVTNPAFLIPIYAVPDGSFGGTGGPYDQIDIRFTFDTENWSPVLNPNGTTGEIDFLLPDERWFSRAGYAPGAPTGSAEVRSYLAGSPSASGDQVRIQWNSVGLATSDWSHWPDMNLTPRHLNPLIYLPFTLVDPNNTFLHMGIVPSDADFHITAGAKEEFATYIWQETMFGNQARVEDAQAQSVDWSYKSGRIEVAGKQIVIRDAHLKTYTRGRADNPISEEWPFRLLSAMFGLDHKTWAAQRVDHAGAERGAPSGLSVIVDKSGLKASVQSSAGVALTTCTFGNSLLKWGNVSSASTGNVIVADTPLTEVQFQVRLRGAFATVTWFGSVQNRAEWLRLEDAVLSFLGVGRRRRLGRPEAAGDISLSGGPVGSPYTAV